MIRVVLAGEAARHLGVAAGPEDEDGVGIARRLHRGRDALGDREHRDEHEHDARDADDRDGRRTHPRPDRADVDAGDGDYLGDSTRSVSPERVNDAEAAGLPCGQEP